MIDVQSFAWIVNPMRTVNGAQSVIVSRDAIRWGAMATALTRKIITTEYLDPECPRSPTAFEVERWLNLNNHFAHETYPTSWRYPHEPHTPVPGYVNSVIVDHLDALHDGSGEAKDALHSLAESHRFARSLTLGEDRLQRKLLLVVRLVVKLDLKPHLRRLSRIIGERPVHSQHHVEASALTPLLEPQRLNV